MPDSLLQILPSYGLYGVTIPQEFGGAGADFLGLVVSIEELCKASASLGAQIAFHNAVVAEAMIASTNKDLRGVFLPKLASGILGAFFIDARSPVSCKSESDYFILNGTCEYVMSAVSAGIFLILTKMADGSRALVCFSKQDGDGLRIGPAKKLLGMRASQTASIHFHDLKIPRDSILFEPSRTDSSLQQITAKARLIVAAQALGIGQASLDAAIKYSNERSQFKTTIGSFYAVRDFIAQDEISLQSARSITYSVADEISLFQTPMRDSAIAKIAASDAAVSASRHSIRIHGGYGFIRDYQVERYLRDARATQIYIESNEALKGDIAGSLLGKNA